MPQTYLVLEPPTRPLVIDQTPVAVAAPPCTILIVDDIASNRDVLRAILRQQGHRFIEAADGADGLAAARVDRPDLIITDVLMPVMDGYEFLRQLRLDPALSNVPVVFYTAHYGEREAHALATSSGVAHVLTKPVDSAEVLEIVDRLLRPASRSTLMPTGSPLNIDFDRRHLRLLTDKLSNTLAEVISANGRLRALINIGAELASEEDSGRRLASMAESARDLFDATFVTIGELDPSHTTLKRFVSYGTSKDGEWLPLDAAPPGILGRAVSERRAFRGNNPGGDPTRLGLPTSHPASQAFVVAPIASSNNVYGWICLVRNDGTTFTDDDEHLVLVLAGQVGRIHELAQQVGEREQAELAARRERDTSQRYLDTAGVMLVALDCEARVTLVNKFACTALGWSSEELLGRNFIEHCLPPRVRHQLSDAFERMLGGKAERMTNEILTRSGEERLIEWRTTLLRDESGAVTGMFSSGTDVTEQEAAVRALRAAEERTRFALDTAGVGIWDMNFTAGTLQWSTILESQYGMQPGTFPGTMRAFVERIHPDDRDAVAAVMDRADRSGEDFVVQNRALWADGTVRWLDGSGRIYLDEQGIPVRGIGISRDVTDRRQLEAQYQQAQKMEAVGRLAGGVAHDFNNLLTIILGNCEVLSETLGSSDPRQADVVEIQKAGSSAAKLTRQLLAFSRKQIVEPIVLDLNSVISDLRPMVERLIGEGITVNTSLQSRVGCVKADRGQIEQVIMNLAVNARDAMNGSGTLTIETSNVELDAEYAAVHLHATPGPYVGLIVSDTGCGMSAEVQAQIFEPFFTTKPVGEGTGLGLSTVHGIVAASGGTASVYSELGHGTSFKLYFPRVDEAATVEAVVLPPREALGVETVLVVEDAAGLRGVIKRLLEQKGFVVLVAGNATEAREQLAANESIHVLLTDVVMPGSTGPELAAEFALLRPSLRVVFMSGYTEDTIVHHGVVNPGIAFLQKPFSSDALARKLRDVLDR